jgi:hypothetical protein
VPPAGIGRVERHGLRSLRSHFDGEAELLCSALGRRLPAQRHYDGSTACNVYYSDSIVKLQFDGPPTTSLGRTTLTQADVASVQVLRNCRVANSPALYVRKYK